MPMPTNPAVDELRIQLARLITDSQVAPAELVQEMMLALTTYVRLQGLDETARYRALNMSLRVCLRMQVARENTTTH